MIHLLFDLDGTLTDPFHGITKCIQYALESLGRPVPAAGELRWCIGPPLRSNFATLLDTRDERLLDEALVKYRERFGTVGLFENEVYPGIEQALAGLQQRGHCLSVATSKPTVYARRIIDHFGLGRYFRTIDGSELDGTRSDKTSLIAHILQRDGITPDEAVMIGDRRHDIFGAHQNRVAGLGVLWGYGSREELEGAGARVCAASPQELADAVDRAAQFHRPAPLPTGDNESGS